MRKCIDFLSGIVSNKFKKNPLKGDLFIFMNARHNQLKMLHWQGDGFALYYKRLEKGTYELPDNQKNNCLDLTPDRLLHMDISLKETPFDRFKQTPAFQLHFLI